MNSALVSVVGVLNDQTKIKSSDKSVAKDKGKKKSTPTKPAKSSAHRKIEALDQK